MLKETLGKIDQAFNSALEQPRRSLESYETGVVTSVGYGIAEVEGLPNVQAEELVELGAGTLGIALELASDRLGVVLLSEEADIAAGSEVRRLGRITDAPVGKGLLGRVIDATGAVRDAGGALRASERRPVERPAPAIMDRAPVSVPLQTGLKSVDALIPIGRGQRELIIGDRQTGKTSIAVDTIINQKDRDVICIYCAIGQRGTAVARVVDTLREHEVMEQVIVVVGADEDPPGLRFITPYAATTMAEYFMDQGRDVLLVYDDLTRHARAYRELSLLLRRPPGREAYPGDIFYIHSRLLERATHLTDEWGGGSLTALPIVETQAENVAAYIPTNLISITDGQIYVSPRLFRKGLLPAIDIGMSVSRVGGKTQLPAYRVVAGDLRLAYSQFEELEAFARFATRMDEDTRAAIERGRRVREVLKQPEHAPLAASEQIIVLLAVNQGLFDELPVDKVADGERVLRRDTEEQVPDIARRIESGTDLSDEEWRSLERVAQDAIASARARAS